MRKARVTVEGLLDHADIKINGSRAWDMQVTDGRVFRRILRDASLGLGEAYMDGWWEARDLEEFIRRLPSKQLHLKMKF